MIESTNGVSRVIPESTVWLYFPKRTTIPFSYCLTIRKLFKRAVITVINTIQKISERRLQIQVGDVINSGSDISKAVSAMSNAMPFQSLKIVGAIAGLSGGLFSLMNHFSKEYGFNSYVLTA